MGRRGQGGCEQGVERGGNGLLTAQRASWQGPFSSAGEPGRRDRVLHFRLGLGRPDLARMANKPTF
jgi:hypothetical protein